MTTLIALICVWTGVTATAWNTGGWPTLIHATAALWFATHLLLAIWKIAGQ
jgi:hypothetical protein